MFTDLATINLNAYISSFTVSIDFWLFFSFLISVHCLFLEMGSKNPSEKLMVLILWVYFFVLTACFLYFRQNISPNHPHREGLPFSNLLIKNAKTYLFILVTRLKIGAFISQLQKRELKSGLVIEPEKNIQLTWHAKKLKIKIITLHNVCAVHWGDVQYTGGMFSTLGGYH